MTEEMRPFGLREAVRLAPDRLCLAALRDVVDDHAVSDRQDAVPLRATVTDLDPFLGCVCSLF